ncbi:hypothetical protein DFH09DRAFT_925136, partial [Mycena vulgaris]
HLQGEAFPDVQLDEIARRTNGYSGSDLKSQDVSSYDLCVSAATEAAKESMSNATANGATVDAEGHNSTSRVLAPKHFEHALAQVSPSTRDNSELDRWHQSFTSQTGADGNTTRGVLHKSSTRQTSADGNTALDEWYQALRGRTSADRAGSIHST